MESLFKTKQKRKNVETAQESNIDKVNIQSIIDLIDISNNNVKSRIANSETYKELISTDGVREPTREKERLVFLVAATVLDILNEPS
ncbi:unnamed protein product [Brachionus calyciflorus]|uniref:Uncharacterized protein n=1 Tax=Brachionus calyciflorus TaxID=104777 RepID=A0A814SBZ2_9BILA|nr:unnamed protein product [Brachionus calyciflorus]